MTRDEIAKALEDGRPLEIYIVDGWQPFNESYDQHWVKAFRYPNDVRLKAREGDLMWALAHIENGGKVRVKTQIMSEWSSGYWYSAMDGEGVRWDGGNPVMLLPIYAEARFREVL